MAFEKADTQSAISQSPIDFGSLSVGACQISRLRNGSVPVEFANCDIVHDKVDSETEHSSIDSLNESSHSSDRLLMFEDESELKATFGTAKPTFEQLCQTIRKYCSDNSPRWGSDPAAVWSLNKLAAVGQLLNNFEAIRDAKDESIWPFTNGDFISAEKVRAFRKRSRLY